MFSSPHTACCSIPPCRSSTGAESDVHARSPSAVARTRPGPAPFLSRSVIDPLHEPLVAAEVVEQLAQQRAVEKRFPVFAHDRLLPPFGLDLPPRDRVDRTRPHPSDEGGGAVGVQRDCDWGGRREQARHAKRYAGSGEVSSAGRGLRTTLSP